VCFDLDARPPDPPADLAPLPIAGGAAAERLELTSEDGTRFAAALAAAPEPGGRAVVLLPDIRGLYAFYVELAERLADAGHHAIAIDFFGRTAGTAERTDDFEAWPHVQSSTPAQIQADMAAAIAALRERTGADEVVAIGFCFGGAQAYLAAANPDLGLAGVIAFYGALDGTRLQIESPPTRAGDMRGPILGLFGGADAGISAEQVEAFDAALDRAGVEHEIVVYPGAPHSFFDRKAREHAEASEDAWRRVLGFLRAGG
jgi:carboxymethylenebutenolidase